jgi:hypothetical protein
MYAAFRQQLAMAPPRRPRRHRIVTLGGDPKSPEVGKTSAIVASSTLLVASFSDSKTAIYSAGTL